MFTTKNYDYLQHSGLFFAEVLMPPTALGHEAPPLEGETSLGHSSMVRD